MEVEVLNETNSSIFDIQNSARIVVVKIWWVGVAVKLPYHQRLLDLSAIVDGVLSLVELRETNGQDLV